MENSFHAFDARVELRTLAGNVRRGPGFIPDMHSMLNCSVVPSFRPSSSTPSLTILNKLIPECPPVEDQRIIGYQHKVRFLSTQCAHLIPITRADVDGENPVHAPQLNRHKKSTVVAQTNALIEPSPFGARLTMAFFCSLPRWRCLYTTGSTATSITNLRIAARLHSLGRLSTCTSVISRWPTSLATQLQKSVSGA